MTIRTKMRLQLTGRKTFTVIRRTPDTYVNGRLVQGTETTFEVKGNEQPLPGYEIQMLPEAFRSKDVRKFFTLTYLNSVEEASQQPPDKVVIDSVPFEVHKRKSFHMGPREHYELVLVREEQSAGGTS